MSGERVSVSRRGLAALLEAMREVWGDVDYLDGADGDEIVKSAAELQALIDGLDRGDVLDEMVSGCRYVRDEHGGHICGECGNDYRCPRPSRFQVHRTPNPGGSYAFAEACGEHVGDCMADMFDGEPSATMLVKMHWDGEVLPVCECAQPLPAEMAPRR